ncbi:PIG-L deacetylase family protein [Pseudonocardia acidicola]|uniref:PIG-L family deacetylase n=1 Tax=Pseudonocardia acidicola TaxID=2724939 RepID=A0ABX1SEZ3_9PSEU|nr:PIG-L family deacetylase [Pseudonocardia acidicola]NMH99675.1 PIG-L family deacetylase [Pseudonocardia acidicola]
MSDAECPALAGLARLRLRRWRTVIVVAAHLDEELCAAGGLLASLAGHADLRVLAVTDGDGGTPRRLDRAAAQRLRRRRAKLAAAYQHLGLGSATRYRLSLTSGAVAAAEHDVVAAISELLGFADPAGLLCLAPWSGDGHPDHDAVGRAATLACQAYRTRLASYLVTPWEQPGFPDLPVNRVCRFLLPEVLRTRKNQALAHLISPHHRSTPGRTGSAPGPQGHACEVFVT